MSDSSLQSAQRALLIPASIHVDRAEQARPLGRMVLPRPAPPARGVGQSRLETIKNLLGRALEVLKPGGSRAESETRRAREDFGKAVSALLNALKSHREPPRDAKPSRDGIERSKLEASFKAFGEACQPLTRLGRKWDQELLFQLPTRMSRLSVEEQDAVREAFLNCNDDALREAMNECTGSDFEWELSQLRRDDPVSHQRLMDAFTRLDDAANLLGQAPAAHDELTSHLIELEQAGVALSQRADDLNRLKPVASEQAQRLTDVLVSALQALKGDLQTRQTSLRAMHDANPTSLRDIYHAKFQQVNAAIRALDSKLDGAADNAVVLKKARNALVARKDELLRTSLAPQAAATPPEGKLKQLLGDREEKRMADLLEKTFKAAGLKDAAKHVEHDLHRQHVEVLNSQRWDTITKKVSFTHNGKLVEYASTIQPGPQLLPGYDGKGVCCHTTWEDRHAVNLARSELQDANGATLFAGFRHGVHSAYGIDDAAQRVQANVNRAKETLAAIIASDPQKLAAAKNGETVTLRLASISLLTPDLKRSKLGLGGVANDNERLMLQEQLAAWNAVSGEQTLAHVKDNNGQPIKVEVEVVPMNFGVNLGAIGGLQTVDRTGLLTGWTRANDTNRTALNKLLGDHQARPLGGWVGEFLSSNAAEDKKRIVRELAAQIDAIWNSESYRKGGTDPYKIVSRLAVLTHELGATPVWNCKSGKDRTGELDVEAKFLATQIQLKGEVPAPGHEHTSEGKAQFMQMALNSGNQEMQRLNVGVMGFKLEGMGGVIGAQMGGRDVAQRHAGLSKHVKS